MLNAKRHLIRLLCDTMTSENHIPKVAIWKENFAQHNTRYARFVQSTTKQSVHFRSKILWSDAQTPYGRTIIGGKDGRV